jgi:hypothetical protein
LQENVGDGLQRGRHTIDWPALPPFGLRHD